MKVTNKILENKITELGIEGINCALFRQALTHPSADSTGCCNNQRLEYLGDAVLDMILGEYLYHKYPHWHEGQLTKVRSFLAKEATLAKVGAEMGLSRIMILGKGEEQNGGCYRASTLCDAVEAVIAACYLSLGYEKTRDFVLRYFDDRENRQENEEENPESVIEDYKSLLQEYVQGFSCENVSYRIVKEEGPPHQRKFTAEVMYLGEVIGSGTGKSKKNAEKVAALAGLKLLKEKNHGKM